MNRSTLTIITALALALAACASSPAAPDGDAPALSPKPFTAEQIRDAMPVGTLIRLRIVNQGAVTVEEWHVTEANAESCTIASKILDEDGALLEDQGVGTSRWTELRDHASFQAASTGRSEDRVEVPAGAFDTWTYVVAAPDADGRPTVSTFHFAKSLPGPPVLMTVVVDGAELASMTLVERSSP
jgi:hypothetical protein